MFLAQGRISAIYYQFFLSLLSQYILRFCTKRIRRLQVLDYRFSQSAQQLPFSLGRFQIRTLYFSFWMLRKSFQPHIFQEPESWGNQIQLDLYSLVKSYLVPQPRFVVLKLFLLVMSQKLSHLGQVIRTRSLCFWGIGNFWRKSTAFWPWIGLLGSGIFAHLQKLLSTQNCSFLQFHPQPQNEYDKSSLSNTQSFSKYAKVQQKESIIIVSLRNMNKSKQAQKTEENQISVIKSKRKQSKDVYNMPKNKKEAELFKATESDVVEDSNEQRMSVVLSENDEEKQRKRNEIAKQLSNKNGKISLEVPKTSGFQNSIPHNNESRLMNINLTNSIPFTSLVHKNSQKSDVNEERRFKIFPSQQGIKFSIPSLDEYYTKNKLDYEMNMSMGLNDQASINRQLNGSQYSFFGFRHAEPKVSKKSAFNLAQTTKNKNPPTLGKATKINNKNTYNLYEDEIKQQSYEDEENEQKEKEKTPPRNPNPIKDYQTKGVYLLLGFLMSTIAMILIRNFI